jgi:hypothetical protein
MTLASYSTPSQEFLGTPSRKIVACLIFGAGNMRLTVLSPIFAGSWIPSKSMYNSLLILLILSTGAFDAF